MIELNSDGVGEDRATEGVRSVNLYATLLILMKDVWRRIPESRSYSRPLGVDSILSRSVAIALDEFYRPCAPAPMAD